MIDLKAQTGGELSRQIFNICIARTDSRGDGRNWTKFNAVCCRHNGESIDTRKRAGFLLSASGGIVYHCFNCGFKSGWQPGHTLGGKFIKLLEWFGVQHEEIVKINFIAFRLKEIENTTVQPKAANIFEFAEKSLPEGSKSFEYWLSQTPVNNHFMQAVDYLCQRGENVITSYDFYWSLHKTVSNRVIIPFRWKGKIVGWTARAIFPTRKRYLTESQPNYLFNTECIKPEHKYIIVCEGPFDALAIGGIATLGDHLTPEQCKWLNNTGKTIILLPDREKGGGDLVDIAMREHWYVSFPKWAANIKDASKAVQEYGKLYSLWSVVTHKDNRTSAISIRRKLSLK